MKPLDLSNMRVVDLSQNWELHTPGFATYDGPTIKWITSVSGSAAFPGNSTVVKPPFVALSPSSRHNGFMKH